MRYTASKCERCTLTHKYHNPTGYCPAVYTTTLDYCKHHALLEGMVRRVWTHEPYQRDRRPEVIVDTAPTELTWEWDF